MRSLRSFEAGIGISVGNWAGVVPEELHLLLNSDGNRGATRFHPKFFKHSVDVGFDGSGADRELVRDHLVRFALGEQSQHFAFARGQRRRAHRQPVRMGSCRLGCFGWRQSLQRTNPDRIHRRKPPPVDVQFAPHRSTGCSSSRSYRGGYAAVPLQPQPGFADLKPDGRGAFMPPKSMAGACRSSRAAHSVRTSPRSGPAPRSRPS